NERAVGGIQVLDQNFAALKEYLAMMTGDGRLGNLEAIVLDPPDRGFCHIQLVRTPGSRRVEDNKFGHRLLPTSDYRRPTPQVKRKCPNRSNDKAQCRLIIDRNSANKGVES